MKIEIERIGAKNWMWRRIASNGNVTAHGTGFNSKSGAKQAVVDDAETLCRDVLEATHSEAAQDAFK